MHLDSPVVVGVNDVGHDIGVARGGGPGPGTGPGGTGNENQLVGGTGGTDTVDTSLHHGQGRGGGDSVWLVVDVEDDVGVVLEFTGELGPPCLETMGHVS